MRELQAPELQMVAGGQKGPATKPKDPPKPPTGSPPPGYPMPEIPFPRSTPSATVPSTPAPTPGPCEVVIGSGHAELSAGCAYIPEEALVALIKSAQYK